MHYHTQNQRKIKIEPRIKLNHNRYMGTGEKNGGDPTMDHYPIHGGSGNTPIQFTSQKPGEAPVMWIICNPKCVSLFACFLLVRGNVGMMLYLLQFEFLLHCGFQFRFQLFFFFKYLLLDQSRPEKETSDIILVKAPERLKVTTTIKR